MIQIPGTHVPPIKNRSSKQYYKLTKVKPAVKSMSNAHLAELAKGGDRDAMKEQNRRNKKMMKRKIDVK